MKSLMQHALGADWDKLPPALQAHYRFGTTVDRGHLDIAYPRFMPIVLTLLRVLGALVNRDGRELPTHVEKHFVGERQYWRRQITFPDGKVIHFNSYWVSAGGHQLIEFVNPVLGLQMAARVQGGELHYSGVRFVMKAGPWLLPIPEWLVLGHTTIVEVALDDRHFAMDFRLTHPLLGQVFRYSGVFEADARDIAQ
jgi:hypothetical protein